ncbi:MAG: asparagine synthase-related protein [Gemmatimonadaceae bacterium]
MSAIAALLLRDPHAPTAQRVDRMLQATRPAAQVLWTAPAGSAPALTMGCSRSAWESEIPGEAASLATLGQWTVVADSTLFHRRDLERALDGRVASAASDAAVIAGVLEQWGPDGLVRLEGEFSAVAWHSGRNEIVSVRDLHGQRPLYVVSRDGVHLLASRVESLRVDPAVPHTIDLASVATVAAGLWHHSRQTAYAAIEEAPAGMWQRWVGGRRHEESPLWRPPIMTRWRRARDLDDATHELAQLMEDAVEARRAKSGPTALSLSGGWDSTAVGAAAARRHGARLAEVLRPVSVSYPEGDPGREDDLIDRVTGAWGVTAHWIRSDSATVLGNAVADGASRALPFAHTFEHWNRALMRAARAEGAPVLLTGIGGDALFQASDTVLADLLARGQWIECARQWRARPSRGLRALWRSAIRPALPDGVTRALAAARGYPPPPAPLARQVSMWIEPPALAALGIAEREAAATPPLPTRRGIDIELSAYLTFPFFARIVSTLHAHAEDEGVALRSPLLDERIVRFAASRPWYERTDRGETKVLLRRTMRGTVPEEVLRARRFRTGTTSAYLLRMLRGADRPVVESLLPVPALAASGLVDPRRLQRAWEHVLTHDDDEVAGRICFTLHAESWLRARRGDSGSVPS